MNKERTGILEHFEAISNTFENIYKGRQSSLLHGLIDVLFRKRILEWRLKLMLDALGDIKGKDILDIGCGPGRYTVLLAKLEPKSIVGMDISPLMIELGMKLAETHNVTSICKFENADFLQREFNNDFDIILAAGVFDYICNSEEFLLKIKKLIREKAVLSFPVRWSLWTPIRMAWLYKRGCSSYYYSKKDIRRLFKKCGLEIITIYKIGTFLVPGNYIVVCSH